MFTKPRQPASSMKTVLATAAVLVTSFALEAQEKDPAKRLRGLDAYMEKVVKDWNVPGIGVGVVVNDKLIFAKGYGYRDYERKLPFTPATVCPIASNSKLFTAVAAGLLVEEGKLTWDEPVRESVPSIRFFDDALNSTVTLRDMLSHRTGITRHDSIWYKSDFTRKELFEKLKFLEPKDPIRQGFLYNNMMYAAAGYIIELKSGKTWEEFVRERIFGPLEMTSTVFTIADLEKLPDHGVPFTEKRDTSEIYRIPYYEDTAGVAPAGAIISNIQDLSHWLIALINNGTYDGKKILPPRVLAATREPAIALPNTAAESRGFWENLNSVYGMGRWTSSYRGHLLAYHGGDINGFHSQVSMMPRERIGVVVLVIGDHCASLYNTVSYNVYERLLGLDQTPWSERLLEIRKKRKGAGTEARSMAGMDRVRDTKPSHILTDYVGEYEHPAYGVVKIGMNDEKLQFHFHGIQLPLNHFHYDRFDSPDDEQKGKWSVNFGTNPQGDVDKAVMSLDEAEAAFIRRPEMLEGELKAKLVGSYGTPTGLLLEVTLSTAGDLSLVLPDASAQKLIPYKGYQFRIKEFSDVIFEFVVVLGQVKGLRRTDPSGEFVLPRN